MILYLHMCLDYIHRADKIIIIIMIIIYLIAAAAASPIWFVFFNTFFSFHHSLSFLVTNLCMVLDILQEGGKQLNGGSQDLLWISLGG